MRKYKSRVARRSTRRARRGTRKQSGGMFGKLFDFLGFNKTQGTAVAATVAPAAAATAPAVDATAPADATDKKSWFSKLGSLFRPSPDPDAKDAADAKAAATGPPPPPSEMGGGRKTRHRRRHRK